MSGLPGDITMSVTDTTTVTCYKGEGNEYVCDGDPDSVAADHVPSSPTTAARDSVSTTPAETKPLPTTPAQLYTVGTTLWVSLDGRVESIKTVKVAPQTAECDARRGVEVYLETPAPDADTDCVLRFSTNKPALEDRLNGASAQEINPTPSQRLGPGLIIE